MSRYIPNRKELDGKQLYYSFLAGAQRIFDNQDLLNKINVFPVADADTGTNLTSTMRAIIDTTIPTNSLKQTADAIANAALVGARGNSGIIFAQFLYGFSNEIKADQPINVKSFAAILVESIKYAYEAIANPVEGTMITVMREWVEHIDRVKDKFDDFQQLIAESLHSATKSLKETTEKLEVLKKAKVVDSGAKGFVVFLEGMIDFFNHGEVKRILPARNIIKVQSVEAELISHDEINFRYCTEAMLEGIKLDKKLILNKIQEMGDSLVIAGSQAKLRIHIHTDDPANLFEEIHKYGDITYQKVDDMVMQNQVMTNRLAPIAIVTDSTCDLPDEFIQKHQINVVPLTVHIGDSYYLDRVTLKAEKFYKMFHNLKKNPTTAQPTFELFSNKYSFLSSHYDSIIAVQLSNAMSGTFSNSQKAAKSIGLQTKTNITVIDSKLLTAGLGLVVLRLAKAIESGKYNHEQLILLTQDWIQKSEIYVSVKSLKYIARSGRVNPLKGFIGNLLNLKPVISVDKNGKSVLMEKSFTENGSKKNILKHAIKMAANNQIWEYAITHADNLITAEEYAKELTGIFKKEPLFMREASPVLGANTGPGIVAVSILVE
ncbi:MAG: DegV family EDD domain-containing protein [Bacteroidetes bacterium]|nr:DegV family EDD domain-containing protein [Bacteroidota bacterium]